jgi:hypothetical protein
MLAHADTSMLMENACVVSRTRDRMVSGTFGSMTPLSSSGQVRVIDS